MQMDDLEFTEFVKGREQHELARFKNMRFWVSRLMQPHYTKPIKPQDIARLPGEEIELEGDELIDNMTDEEYQKWLNE